MPVLATTVADLPGSISDQPYPLISAGALLQAPTDPWVVKGVFRAKSVAVLYGDSGTYKSFLALDLALHVVAGSPTWLGRKIKTHGPAVYVAAEGGGGMRNRLTACVNHHGLAEAQIADARFLLERVPLLDDAAVTALLKKIDMMPVSPCLVVLDTLSAAIAGADENGSATMSAAVANARRIAEHTGAAVLVLHHVGKSASAKSVARGHTAFHCAADVMILQEKLSAFRGKLTSKKQRDDPDFQEIVFSVETVFLGMDEDGEVLSSLVVVPDDLDAAESTGHMPILSGSEAHALAVLAAIGTASVTTGAWRAALAQQTSKQKISPKTFHNWRKKLHEAGHVEIVNGKKGLYRVTPQGFDALKTTSASAI